MMYLAHSLSGDSADTQGAYLRRAGHCHDAEGMRRIRLPARKPDLPALPGRRRGFRSYCGADLIGVCPRFSVLLFRGSCTARCILTIEAIAAAPSFAEGNVVAAREGVCLAGGGTGAVAGAWPQRVHLQLRPRLPTHR